jgi:flagellar biosynthesis/type III secretory pathway chaperone
MDCQSIPAYHDGNDERQIQPLIESLLRALKTEIDLQKELQSVLEEECRVLKRPDSNQPLTTNAKKETILFKAMMFDEVIADIVKQISRTMNLRGQQITLSDLSAYASPSLQEELQKCRKHLALLVMNNRELNQSNRDLLDMLLRLVNNSMQVITNLMTADSDYLGTGARNPARMTGAVVCLKG